MQPAMQASSKKVIWVVMQFFKLFLLPGTSGTGSY